MIKKIASLLKSDSNYKKSYSQSGEDLIVKYLKNWLKINDFSYLDIGAFDPVKLNNTYLFYLLGYRGVNIDGNYLSISKFNSLRKYDTNLNLVVSSKTERLTYYQFDSPSLNTVDRQFAESILHEGKYKLIKENSVNAVGINDILLKYFLSNPNFSFLSLDVEGFDFDIIKSLDFKKFNPMIVCVETVEFKETGLGKKDVQLIDYLKSQGYYHYADTFINSIFVKENLFR